MKIEKKRTVEVTKYLLTWRDDCGDRWYRVGDEDITHRRGGARRFDTPEEALDTRLRNSLEYMVLPVTEEVEVETGETLELRLVAMPGGRHVLAAWKNGKRAFCGNILFIREKNGLFSFEGARGIGEGLVHPSNLNGRDLKL